jgi:hypothetical protein
MLKITLLTIYSFNKAFAQGQILILLFRKSETLGHKDRHIKLFKDNLFNFF